MLRSLSSKTGLVATALLSISHPYVHSFSIATVCSAPARAFVSRRGGLGHNPQFSFSASRFFATSMAGSEDKTIQSIVIIVAMQAEADPMIARLGLEQDSTVFPAEAPCQCYKGEYKGAKVAVVTNGKCAKHSVDNVGTIGATLATWLSLQLLKPDLIISAGTAGGFKRKGATIGDVFISSHHKHHDRRIAIPGFTAWGIGSHEAHPTPKLQEALKFKTGVVTSGNSLAAADVDNEMMIKNDASVKEMEAAAIGWVCDLHGDVPMFCIKTVTDIVDGEVATEDEFLANLHTAAQRLQEAVPTTLDFIIGRKLDDI